MTDTILVSLLLTWNTYCTDFSNVSIVDLDQVNVCWVFFNLLFSLDYSTQNPLELTLFGSMKMLTFSIPNSISKSLLEYSTFSYSLDLTVQSLRPILKRKLLHLVVMLDTKLIFDEYLKIVSFKIS